MIVTRKQRGQTSLFQVVSLGLLFVILFATFLLYFPSDSEDSILLDEGLSVDSEILLHELPQDTRAKIHISATTIPEARTTTLGFCAEEDLEVVGYDWDPELAAAKTRSANSKEINANVIMSAPSFHNYVKENQMSQYSEFFVFLGENDSLNDEIDFALISEINKALRDPEKIAELSQKYAQDKRYLVNILSLTSLLDNDTFTSILDTHTYLDNDFIFKLFRSDLSVHKNYLEPLMQKVADSAPLSARYIDQGNDLLFSALVKGNFDYLPHILNMDMNFIPSQSASLYYAFSNGKQRKDFTDAEVLRVQEQIKALVGPPSFNDLIGLSIHSEQNLLDELIQHGINVEEHLTYSPNQDILDMPDDELETKLRHIQENWPLYIIRINPNSECANATEFHWTFEQLASWYNTRVKSDDDFAKADEELSKISRLYVSRAHIHYYSSQLELKPPEFRIDENKGFFDRVLTQIFQPAPGADASQKLTELSTQIDTEERQRILRFYLISLSGNSRILDASTNLGFVYDENDMVAAIRSQNKGSVDWLIKNGVGLDGVDQLNNGVLVWLALNKRKTFLNQSQLDNIPTIYNPHGLSPHELHYLQCESYGSVDKALRRSELGKDIKQQINSKLCETFSGYQKALANADF